MKKKLLFVLGLNSIYMFAPPKGFNHQRTRSNAPENITNGAMAVSAVAPGHLPATIGSSMNFLREEHRAATAPAGQTQHPSRSTTSAAVADANYLDEGSDNDDVDLSTFAVATDLSDANSVPVQQPKGWMALLFKKYYRVTNERCLFQRFCQALGTKRKYLVLLELLEKGQLTNYIDELNQTSVSTGDSLLNEAICQAIQDGKREILIQLLSETLDYKDRLSKETKERIDICLQQDTTDHQLNVSKQLTAYSERIRLTTQIRHALRDSTYEGPNILAMTAHAYAQVKQLTEHIVTNNLPKEEEKDK